MAATVALPPSALISAITTFAPSLAKSRAAAWPIPEAPPVIRAILFASRLGILASFDHA
jgi:hypothetical protein